MPSKERRWIYVVTRVAADLGPTTLAVCHTTERAERAFADAVESYSAKGYTAGKGRRGAWQKSGDVLFAVKLERLTFPKGGSQTDVRHLRLEKWQYGD